MSPTLLLDTLEDCKKRSEVDILHISYYISCLVLFLSRENYAEKSLCIILLNFTLFPLSQGRKGGLVETPFNQDIWSGIRSGLIVNK